MKFRDKFGRPGIALNISGKLPGYQTTLENRKTREDDLNTKDINIVLALFQRYGDFAGKLCYGWGGSDCSIEHAYNEYHNENGHTGATRNACPTCPFVGHMIPDHTLRGILNGTDPLFELVPLPLTPEIKEKRQRLNDELELSKANKEMEELLNKMTDLNKKRTELMSRRR